MFFVVTHVGLQEHGGTLTLDVVSSVLPFTSDGGRLGPGPQVQRQSDRGLASR